MVRNRLDALYVPAAAYAQLLRACGDDHSRQVCGLVFGRNGVVRCFERLDNVAPETEGEVRFAYDPAEAVRLIRLYRRQRFVDVGFFYTHPNDGPWVNEDELSRFVHVPDYYYLVVSTTAGLVSSNVYIVEQQEAKQVPLIMY